jgi:hypothetical protein
MPVELASAFIARTVIPANITTENNLLKSKQTDTIINLHEHKY